MKDAMNTREQATDWFTRLREAEPSPVERRRFVQWLMDSPQHVREYLIMARVWGALQSPRVWPAGSREEFLEIVRQTRHSAVVELHKGAALATASATRPHRLLLALAASVLLAVAGVAFYVLAPPVYQTARGEQREVVLADGSIVQLNTLTRLKVLFDSDRRRIELPRGEALFRVARDPHRPFEVITPYARVRAVGTEFNVYNRPEGTRVAVVEGRVRIVPTVKATSMAGRADDLYLNPQQSVDVNGRGEMKAVKPKRTHPADVQPDIAWRQRRIVLDGDRVDTAVAEFNRYNVRQLRVEDAEIAGLEITGVFNAHQPDALIIYLQEIRDISVSESGNEVRLHR